MKLQDGLVAQQERLAGLPLDSSTWCWRWPHGTSYFSGGGSLEAQSASVLSQLFWLSVALGLNFWLLKAIHDFVQIISQITSVFLCHAAVKTASKMSSMRPFCLDVLHALPIFSSFGKETAQEKGQLISGTWLISSQKNILFTQGKCIIQCHLLLCH